MDTRINLELGEFDVKLILSVLEEKYISSRREVVVDSKWVTQENNCSMFVPKHLEYVETKESKRLKSTINYIKRQINN